ncbi:MAG: (2Fe-2S)-binding protein [Pirellulaceae bacterium]|jgi:aerobic-type carbon monoxide dehydrogenase small subunit (CoxS/CutS family)|nr:(2Fe-2S)-binding protein [Pirellulaceae bacterium]
MTDLTIRVNGRPLRVPTGLTVAAALAMADVPAFRRSVHGQPRSALCGMGICAECRVTIDGLAHQRSCVVLCREAMEVVTDD